MSKHKKEVVMRRAWSKLVPGVHMELLVDDPDEQGMYPVYIYTDQGEGYTVVHHDTISFVELTAVPESVPEVVYIALSGDPATPRADVFFTEREAKFGREGAWGYFPAAVNRNLMVPLKRD